MTSFLTRLAKTFRFGRAQYFVGKDLDSNKYYEYPSLDGSTDPRRTRRVIDYHIFKELGEHDQNKLATQWLMWLRHTRKSAPSIEVSDLIERCWEVKLTL
jgi:NADH dehydrogenase [ubiquinone] 1 alpha subcomplex assembly factor 2